jgi:mono/diheme cytochrome c family protein
LLLIIDHLLTLPEPEPSAEPEDDGPITDAARVIDEYGCAGCHDLEGSEADLGPKLNGISARMDREALRASIIDPNAEITEGYEAEMMPDYFGDDMSEGEMTLLLDYLMKLPE